MIRIYWEMRASIYSNAGSKEKRHVKEWRDKNGAKKRRKKTGWRLHESPPRSLSSLQQTLHLAEEVDVDKQRAP